MRTHTKHYARLTDHLHNMYFYKMMWCNNRIRESLKRKTFCEVNQKGRSVFNIHTPVSSVHLIAWSPRWKWKCLEHRVKPHGDNQNNLCLGAYIFEQSSPGKQKSTWFWSVLFSLLVWALNSFIELKSIRHTNVLARNRWCSARFSLHPGSWSNNPLTEISLDLFSIHAGASGDMLDDGRGRHHKGKRSNLEE